MQEQRSRSEAEVFADMLALCTSAGFIHALAFLSFRDNIVGFAEELKAEDLAERFSPERLIRSELMTLQGLLIKQDIDFGLPASQVVQSHIERADALLKELHDIMGLTMMSELFSQASDQGKSPLTRGNILREAVFYGAESAYVSQYRDFVKDKYKADDRWLSSVRGYTITEAQQVVSAIARHLDDGFAAHLKSLRMKSMEQWSMLPAFTFDAEDLLARVNCSKAVVTAVLHDFSADSLERNTGFNAVDDFNVSNSKPLLRTPNGSFVLFNQYALAEALYESPFYWMAEDSKYVSQAMKHRGSFTESACKESLERVFGEDRVFANVELYVGKDKAAEIDVLVIYANRAVIVQAKSKRMTIDARKGNDGRVQDDFKKSIQSSYDQGVTCARFLREKNVQLRLQSGETLQVKQELEEIYIVCAVADHYPALAHQAREFLTLQTDSVVQPPLVADVFTLDVMTEMLRTPLHFLSYLNRRVNYHEKIISSHEISILAYHLRKNLWIEGELTSLVLDDSVSVDLDVAMAVRRDGLPGAAVPDGILTRIPGTAVGHIISQIEATAQAETIDFGLLLLSLSEEAVNGISEKIELIAGRANDDHANHDLTIPIGGLKSGFTVHVNLDEQTQAVNALYDHITRRKYVHKADSWHGICLSPLDRGIRFGCRVRSKWVSDDGMERKTALVRRYKGMTAIRGMKPARKIGRNEKCPCGSGLKYKRCCLER